jgi:hypothetical protein
MKNFYLAIILILLTVLPSLGQKAKPPVKIVEQTRGAISGTIFDETGSPIEEAEISISTVGSQRFPESFRETTARNGKFRFENLKPRRYKIYVRYAGYVLPEEFEISGENQKTYQINQELNLIVRKGGVITGKVLDENGQPIIKVRVHVVRIRDEFGRKIPAQEFARFSQQNFTDDRGIYRVFGLAAGSYLVYIGGDYSYERTLKTQENSPVYYPSDSVDTAGEVRVGFGEEINSIDINFRQIQGFRVSGTILGATPKAVNNGSVFMSLINAVNGVETVQTQTNERDGKYAFQIEQIPAGEYEIRAFQFAENGMYSKNPLQKIKIKSADISGLVINLKPLNSIKGNASIEKKSDLKLIKECADFKETNLISMIIKFDSAAKEKSILDSIEKIQQNISATPEENGDFEINQLESGKYYFKADFPNENLYVKEIFQQFSVKEKRDLSDGFNFQNGENLENVKIVFSEGAAKISGKLIISEKEKAENPQAKFIIYLIPADLENKDNVLLYAQTIGNSDETFLFSNIAPGNYFVSAEKYSPDKENPQESLNPKFWDAKERLRLFEEAKKREGFVTLKPCQNSNIEIKNG